MLLNRLNLFKSMEFKRRFVVFLGDDKLVQGFYSNEKTWLRIHSYSKSMEYIKKCIWIKYYRYVEFTPKTVMKIDSKENEYLVDYVNLSKLYKIGWFPKLRKINILLDDLLFCDYRYLRYTNYKISKELIGEFPNFIYHFPEKMKSKLIKLCPNLKMISQYVHSNLDKKHNCAICKSIFSDIEDWVEEG